MRADRTRPLPGRPARYPFTTDLHIVPLNRRPRYPVGSLLLTGVACMRRVSVIEGFAVYVLGVRQEVSGDRRREVGVGCVRHPHALRGWPAPGLSAHSVSAGDPHGRGLRPLVAGFLDKSDAHSRLKPMEGAIEDDMVILAYAASYYARVVSFFAE